MYFYEMLSGARLHANFIHPGNIKKAVPKNFEQELFYFCDQFKYFLTEFEEILFKNRI